jgi:hypothetical protein
LSIILEQEYNIDEIFSSIKFPKTLKELIISFGKCVFRERRLQKLFINNTFPNLNKLVLSCDNDGDINSSLLLPQSLTSLDIEWFSLNFSMTSIIQMFSVKFINLIDLDISNQYRMTGVGFRGLLPPSLKILNLSKCESIEDEGLCDILSNNLPNLEQLYLYRLSKVTGSISFPPLPQSLILLFLRDIKNLSEYGLVTLLSSLSNLKHLHLSGNRQLTGNCLKGLLSSSLESLYLNRCKSITNDGLCSILSNNLSNLQMLSIGQLKLLTNEGMVKMILPSSLTAIDVSGLNDNIDENSMTAMLSNNKLLDLTTLRIKHDYYNY